MSSAHEQISPAEALAVVRARIEKARAAAISPAPSITLIAVTKTQTPDRIKSVLDAGHRAFGENRVQEAGAKWPDLRRQYSGVELHLVGPLQTNKVQEAIELFDVIETLDRPKLAEALKAQIARTGKSPALFVQVNTGEEPQKSGVAPADAPSFIAFCRDKLKLPVQGLMCIPPASEHPAPHFALLAKLAKAHKLPFLSMGMSSDFEVAVKFGATHVRVGTAIFGARDR